MRIPSQTEKDEIEKVRGMQVRTQAMAFASQVSAGKLVHAVRLTKLAAEIAAYIEQGTLAG